MSVSVLPLLAAQGAAATPRVLLALGLMIVALLVLSVVLLALRRRLLSPDRDATTGLFDDLRQMLREGRITQEEYDAVRKRMAARLSGERTASPQPGEDR